MAKYSKKAGEKIEKVMHEMKEGKLTLKDMKSGDQESLTIENIISKLKS